METDTVCITRFNCEMQGGSVSITYQYYLAQLSPFVHRGLQHVDVPANIVMRRNYAVS